MVEFVARQLRAAPSDLASYEWTGRTVERHRAQIRKRLGFRECTVADADQLTAWLAENITERERRADRVHEELLAPVSAQANRTTPEGRADRVVRSALHIGEEAVSSRVGVLLG